MNLTESTFLFKCSMTVWILLATLRPYSFGAVTLHYIIVGRFFFLFPAIINKERTSHIIATAVWTNTDQKPAGVYWIWQVLTVQAGVWRLEASACSTDLQPLSLGAYLCMRCAYDCECGSLSLHSYWLLKLVRAFPFRIRERPKNLSALAHPPSSWSPPGPDLSQRLSKQSFTPVK